jgi:hypothetical protein
MIKTARLVQQIPLIDIKQMEDDGVDAFERIKMQMAVQIVRDLPKGLFDKLFKTTIINPRNEEQWFNLIKKYKENQTSYNESLLDKFRELKNRELAEIEMFLEINTD